MHNTIIHSVTRKPVSWSGFFIICICIACSSSRQMRPANAPVNIIAVDTAWANNSVNTVVFRKNSLTSLRDTQYIAYYDANGFVVLGKRKLDTRAWQLQRTNYKGNVVDAHNSISIMIDNDGYLHMVWDQHNTRLRYVKSVEPGSLQMSAEMPMTSKHESRVSYPEFYRLPGGDLLFFFRDGSSGNGNLVINKYNLKTKQWSVLQSNLISGEGKRSAYWQAYVDDMGGIHISWVWRESPDVASNHDLCYARSRDGGHFWETTDFRRYRLPVTESTAEVACRIPQGSQLINQTSMCTDAYGMPVIASYWCDSGSAVPQYHIVYRSKKGWEVQNPRFRSTPFNLSGMGTKRIPISRPQVIAWGQESKLSIALIYRDAERSNKVSVAFTRNFRDNKWTIRDLYRQDVGSWEPSFDTDLWRSKKQLHLFVQRTEQADAEGKSDIPAQLVQVLEWRLQ